MNSGSITDRGRNNGNNFNDTRSSTNLKMYTKNQQWQEQKQERLRKQRDVSREKEEANLTFRPKIKNMISEAVLTEQNLQVHEIRSLTPDSTIP